MKDNRLGNFEEELLLIVGILAEEAYTLRISEEYQEQAKRNASVGSVHSTLNRLEKKGFLSSKMGDPSAIRGGRRKRIYEITALGEQTLSASRDFKLSLWRQYPPFSTGNLSFG